MTEDRRPIYEVSVEDAIEYDRHTFDSPLYQGLASNLLGLAEIKSGEKVLCLAAGTGLDARKATEMGGEVIGLEKATAMILAAKKVKSKWSLINSLIQGEAEVLPLPSNHFDIVMINAAGEYLDMSRVFQQVARVLKPGGRFVFNCQADEAGHLYRNDPQRKLRDEVESIADEEGYSIEPYSKRKGGELSKIRLQRYAEQSGLTFELTEDIGIAISLEDVQKQLKLAIFNKRWLAAVPEGKREELINQATQALRKKRDYDQERHWYFFKFIKPEKEENE